MREKIPCYLPGELNGTSLVERLLEIGRDYAMEDDRSDTSDHWFGQLECLSENPVKRKVLERAIRDPDDFNPRDFIAVSYSFESAYKSLNKYTLNFEIRNPEGRFIKKVKTRDVVLRRVLNYAAAVGCQYFWIDQECFDQNDPEEHQAAMDSMDLVYKRSKYSIALLEITFGPSEVYLIDLLMTGCLEDCSRNIDSMVDMLRHVQSDKWWKRAWTFQEEYLASRKMKILIRHTAKPGEYEKTDLTRIEGEVRVSAALFRERATNFLLCPQHSKMTDDRLQDTCKSLLDTFRRYSVVAQTTESAMGKAMSTTVFEDLESRNRIESYDFLPIAANVCGYQIRLRSDQLARRRSHSVGMCALTMYLLNGEIFYNNCNTANPAVGMGLSQYLSSICLDKLKSPPEPLELSWFKMCRLWPVKLSSEGIITKGYLWHVQAEIKTTNWKWARFWKGAPKKFGLNRFRRDRLLDFMDGLERLDIYHGLWCKLGRYLKEDGELRHNPEWPKDYMNTMAVEIVDAICDEKSLYVATLEESSEAFTTFTMGDEEDSCSDMAVQAGASDSEHDSGDDGNQSGDGRRSESFAIFTMGDDEVTEGSFRVFTSTSRSHQVSITVEVAETANKPQVPLMTITGWVNGLAFYDKVRQRKAVVHWPEAWKRKLGVEQSVTRKRKRSSESPRVEAT